MLNPNQVEQIDQVSSSFCLAKWLQVTIDLVHGTNHSCHHPVRHQIDEEQVRSDPNRLHNTIYKIERRKEMLEGVRPRECEYCWKIEDAKGDHYSDRYIKSTDQWAYPHLEQVLTNPLSSTVAPTYLEVMLDKACPFSCTYCSQAVSSSIAHEMKKYGDYPIHHADHRASRDQGPVRQYHHDANPFIEAFWPWFSSIASKLEYLRLTGGEPLISPKTDQLLQALEQEKNRAITFAVNTNLGMNTKRIETFLEKVSHLKEAQALKRFELYTSIDTYGAQAEFIRQGLSFELFEKNLRLVCERPEVDQVVVMTTYSLLSIPQFDLFIAWIGELKQRYPKLTLDISYLKEPVYLRANIVTLELKKKIHSDLCLFEKMHTQGVFSSHELNKMKRIYHWVCGDEPQHLLHEYRSDFYSFILEFSRRYQHDFLSLFPELEGFLTTCRKHHLVQHHFGGHP